jgi:hypothetical protein
LLRRILPFTTVVMVMAGLWTGWTLYSRRRSAEEAERQSEQRQAEADQKLVAAFGGDQLTILGFVAEPGSVSPGGRALMCYGVSNAAKVGIEPGIEPIQPALSHCLEVFPRKTTKYTLTAKDARGNTKSASLTIRVR